MSLKQIGYYIRRPWDFIAGNIDALGFLSKAKDSKQKLKEAQQIINNCRDLSNWYRKEKIEYKSDKIDFRQLAWVTIAKKCGDCEDFVELSKTILKNKFHLQEGYCEKIGGNGHAILSVRESDDNWWLMSNHDAFGPFKTQKEVALYTYKKETGEWFFI